MRIKLCKDCKWYNFNMWSSNKRFHQCHNPHPSMNITSLITGGVLFGDCAKLRFDSRKCGTSGEYWEAIDEL